VIRMLAHPGQDGQALLPVLLGGSTEIELAAQPVKKPWPQGVWIPAGAPDSLSAGGHASIAGGVGLVHRAAYRSAPSAPVAHR